MTQTNYERYSGVIVDSCRFHGVFLDAMELEKIQLFVRSGGKNKSKERKREENRYIEKSQARAKKRRELNEARSSYAAVRHRGISAESTFMGDVIETVGDFFVQVFRSFD